MAHCGGNEVQAELEILGQLQCWAEGCIWTAGRKNRIYQAVYPQVFTTVPKPAWNRCAGPPTDSCLAAALLRFHQKGTR